MRLFLLFLLPALAHSIVLDSDAFWKSKQNMLKPEYALKNFKKLKKAKEHVKQFCTPSKDFSMHLVCHEVMEEQLFPLPMDKEVLILRLVLDTFYEHKNEIIAYFSKNKKLVLPEKTMNVTRMRQIQKAYNL